MVQLKFTRPPNRFRGKKEIVDFMSVAGFDVAVHASPINGVEEEWFVGKKK
jgi:hypothetical protein